MQSKCFCWVGSLGQKKSDIFTDVKFFTPDAAEFLPWKASGHSCTGRNNCSEGCTFYVKKLLPKAVIPISRVVFPILIESSSNSKRQIEKHTVTSIPCKRAHTHTQILKIWFLCHFVFQLFSSHKVSRNIGLSVCFSYGFFKMNIKYDTT